uniref:Uncharacterized protein n=1 Tax=Picea glauca TaxID=3330 RepID=A0A101LYC7_PICGL|nr:hypothetical protein ABT39_MTgene5793 [Picea glauca]QHR90431.1 hypothetical protein Q903MT_gene4455 [Picea sitchensis]
MREMGKLSYFPRHKAMELSRMNLESRLRNDLPGMPMITEVL